MGLPFIDNSVPYGTSRVNTKATPATIFVAEHIVFNFPTALIERKDQSGKPNGFVLVQGQPTGTCTLQLPSTATVWPVLGDILENWQDLPAVGPYNVNPGAWVLSSLGAPFEQLGYVKMNVTLTQALFTSS